MTGRSFGFESPARHLVYRREWLGESRLKTARKTVILHSQCRYKDTVTRKVNAEEVFSTLNADCKCHSCYRMNKASGPFRFPNEGA